VQTTAVTIRAQGLGKSFGKGAGLTKALSDVSLGIGVGQMTTIIGPSGSGKSTLLAILSGLLRPDTGRVEALGTDLWSLSDVQREAFRRRHCGFIFQQYNLFAALTAAGQVGIALRWASALPRGETERLGRETLVSLGLGAKLHLRPHELSGGEKQRVAVARALAKKPDLIFADEPTAALDWANGQQVIALLKAACASGVTVVLVCHDPRVIPLSDRVLHLEDGCLLESAAAAPAAAEQNPGANR
jgi:putative ABC transport system ATP-binding protein